MLDQCLHGFVVNTVSRRYQNALSGAALSATAFESINAWASQESVQTQSTREENAQRERHCDVKVMDIYDIKMKQCESAHSMIRFA